jgi:hypothetical protein
LIGCGGPILSVESLDPAIDQEKWGIAENHCGIDLESDRAAVSICVAPIQTETHTSVCLLALPADRVSIGRDDLGRHSQRRN